MNKITIYSSLPYWLQNIAVSLHGYKLKRQRFNDDFYKILDFLNSTHGWSKEQIRSYKEEHTFKILEQIYLYYQYNIDQAIFPLQFPIESSLCRIVCRMSHTRSDILFS